MATEQDWAAYADQAYLLTGDTILARTAAGAGVEVPGSEILAKRVADGPFVGNKGIQLNGSCSIYGVAPEDHGSSFAIDFASYCSIGQQNGGASPGWWGWNVRGDATVGQYRYRVTGDVASVLELTSGGALVFKNAAAGTAGAVAGLSTRYEFQASGTLAPGFDNAQDLGTAGLRWGTLFAGAGTINTSDERKKKEIGEIPEAWLDAWGEVEWRRFKFIGGERWHTGLIAQKVHAAFAAHDIDAFEIGLCCFDEWTERCAEVYDDEGALIEGEKGEIIQAAGDAWGLRYDECFAIEAAWQRRELKRMADRLAVLENASG